MIVPALALEERLNALRERLAAQNLDGFLVPMADEFANEYIPASERRLEFLSGFSGSAGFIIVLAREAAFFTDSRYTLQASEQVPSTLYTRHDVYVTSPTAWLKDHAPAKTRLGFDPRLHPASVIERYQTDLLPKQILLVPTETNLIDALWTDRPAEPCARIYAYDLSLSGRSSAEKRKIVAAEMKKQNLGAFVLTDPASVAWLLNVRGGDAPHTPLPLSYAILRSDETVEWFVEPKKVTEGLDTFLGSGATRYAKSDFTLALKRLGEAKTRVRLATASASYAIAQTLKESGAMVNSGLDLCALPKACKNEIELEGVRAAHRRDGAALVKLFAWLEASLQQGEEITELLVEEKLEKFRSEAPTYRGPSFDTIAGAGPHGAIVHYRATPETNRKITEDSFFLLDSGGQYIDGTTDVTRTVIIGHASDAMKDRFTRVLKGHIALASVRFPEGTSGADLDTLARQFLWQDGLDYGHSTGHGVGTFLGVHEGPQAISRRNTIPLKPGMVLSNEPGYYKPDHYGIRHENLQAVIALPTVPGAEQTMMGFEPLTLMPFDRQAMDFLLLTDAELDWLDAYHLRVFRTLRPMLDGKEALWLENATAPLKR